jgi:hypothetical protein
MVGNPGVRFHGAASILRWTPLSSDRGLPVSLLSATVED